MIRCDIDNASSNELFKFCIINEQMIRRHLEDFRRLHELFMAYWIYRSSLRSFFIPRTSVDLLSTRRGIGVIRELTQPQL